MTEYCTRVVGGDGRVEKFRVFDCDTDANAIVWARHLMDDRKIELWSGDRMVQILLPPAPLDTGNSISHNIVEGRLISKAGG